jgi:hypothetical protein
MAIFGKSPDASEHDRRRLSNEWRTTAVETEVNAIGKSEKEIAEAASRAEGQRKVADQIDPDKP